MSTYSMITGDFTWLTNMYPRLKVNVHLWKDEITFLNMDNGRNLILHRYTIEDAKDPKELMIETARQVMTGSTQIPSAKEFGELVTETLSNSIFGSITRNAVPNLPTDYSIALPPQSMTTIVSNGTGTASNPFYVSPESAEIVEKQMLGKKLFTTEEANLLKAIKDSIRTKFDHNRTTSERKHSFDMNNVVIAGGCFASLINMETPNDFDVFILDTAANKIVSNMMYNDAQAALQYPEEFRPVKSGANTALGAIGGYVPVKPKIRIGNSNYMNNENIDQTIFFQDSKFQYITTKYKSREELISHFDYKHCCVSYDYMTNKLFITREVYDLIKSKTLVPNTNKPPEQWRYEKFFNRGWRKRTIELVDDLMTL